MHSRATVEESKVAPTVHAQWFANCILPYLRDGLSDQKMFDLV
jgi:hypothetical protein